MPDLDPRVTALVLIDKQNGILGRPVTPRVSPGPRTCRITSPRQIRLEAA